MTNSQTNPLDSKSHDANDDAGAAAENPASALGASAEGHAAPAASGESADDLGAAKDDSVDRPSPFATGRNFAADGKKHKTAMVKSKGRSSASASPAVISPLALQPASATASVPSYAPAHGVKHKHSSGFRSVNVKFLLGLIVVLVVCVGSAMGLHTFQVRRLAVSLLDQQRRAAREGDDKLAARYLGQYLSYEEGDVERHAELAELLHESADSSRDHFRALQYMEKVIRMDPSRTSIRQLLVDKLMLFGRFNDALEHLEVLKAKVPATGEAAQKGELEYKIGLCHHAIQNYQKASIAYRNAIASDAAQLEAYQNLAMLLRRNEFQQADEADKLIDGMVAANSHLAGAFAGRARYLIATERADQAAPDVATAHKIAPKDLDVLALVLQLVERDIPLPEVSSSEVNEQLERLLEETPQEPRLYLMLATLAQLENRDDDAVKWLTAGVKALPNNTDMSVQLAGLWVQQGKLDEAKTQVELLKQNRQTETIGAYLEAEILLNQKEWVAARKALSDLLKRIPPESPLALQTHLGLAKSAKALRDPDAEILAYRHILAHRPEADEIQKLLAAALAATGKRSEAMTLYEAEVDSEDKPLVMAQMMIRDMLKRPPEKRNWDQVEKALQQAEQQFPERVEVPILLAQMYESKGDLKQAGDTLARAGAKHPGSELLWAGRIEFAARRQDWDGARQIIDEGRKQLGDKPIFRLANISLLMAHDRKAVPAAIDQLKRDLPNYSPADQNVLMHRLAALYQIIDNDQEALAMWEEIVKRNPKNLNSHLAFLELAVHAQDLDAARRELNRLQQVEGENGPHWRLGRAAITLLEVVKGELPSERLEDVRRELEGLKKDRPNWSQVWVMSARTEEQAGKIPAAIEAYRGAIDRGDGQAGTALRLIALLVSQRQFAEADSLIRTYMENANWSRTALLYQLASETAVQLRDRPRALEYARKAAELQPSDARTQMRLAQLLGGDANAADEIEAALRKAIEADPKKAAPWLSLVRHLASANRLTEAEETLKQAEEQIEEKDLAVFLANGYEMLNQPQKAEEQYLTALSLNSDDAAVLTMVSEFYMRHGMLDKAEPLLDKLLSEDIEVAQPLLFEARRRMATILAQKNYTGLQQGLALIDKNAADAKPLRADLALRARLLSQYPRPENRREAVRLFKELEAESKLTADDEMRLAKLLTTPDEQPQADQRWQKLAAEYATQPAILVGAIRHFHERGKPDLAEPVLEQLQSLSPNEAVTFELSAENAARRKQVAGAIAIYKQYIERSPTDDARPQRTLQAAAMANRLTVPAVGLDVSSDDAQALLDFAASNFEQVQNQFPEAQVGLAGLRVRQHQFDAAIDLYEQILTSQGTPQVIGTLIALTKNEPLSPEQRDRVRNIIDGHIATHMTPAMKWQLPSWQDGQGQNAEAIQTYRELLAENENSVIAMNNLAWLLALEKTGVDEARQLVDRAMQIAGPISDLLDTKGVVEILAGDYQQAVATLETAIAESDSAVRRFHLALAYAGAENLDGARFHLDEAHRLGLKEFALDDQEVILYRGLQEKLQAN